MTKSAISKIYFLFIIFLSFISENIFSQKIIFDDEVISYENDSVIFYLQDVRGSIQWEVSSDAEVWSPVPGKTNESFMFRVDSSAYYRAKITEGTCNVIYTDTVLIAEVYDTRTGQIYEAVRIGSNLWMAENLNFYTPQGSYYYDNDSVSYSEYGRLYNWETAKVACPAGWHLPDESEWQDLEIALGMDPLSADSIEWRGTNQATKLFAGGSSGFNLLFGGQKYPSFFSDVEVVATFWTATTNDDKAYYRGFHVQHDDIHKDLYQKDFSFSVRCVRNRATLLLIDSIKSITDTSFTAYLNYVSDGGSEITERGICWSINANPTVFDNHLSTGSGTGMVDTIVSGLSQATTFYIRAYATNSEGTKYSDQVIVSTYVALPVVTTVAITSIASNTATGGGNVLNKTGITVLSKGVCWSTSHNPTIDGNKTTNGTGFGAFTSSLTGLSPNTKYYVRAYASVNGGVAYGNEVSFTTIPANETGTLTDSRTGKVYKTVHIGNQWWMAENLAYYTSSGSWYYEEDSASYKQYGRFYDWNTALTSCPSGWHLPSDNDWKALEINIGMPASDAENTDWRGTTQATLLMPGGSTGFNVLFAGQKYNYGSFNDLGSIATFWSSTGDSEGALYRGFHISHTNIHREIYAIDYGYSVRCVKNSTAEIVLDSIADVKEHDATAYIKINLDGGTPITERGVCWGTSALPTVTSDHTTNGTGIGSFNIVINSLSHTTTYYVRAYAKNADGIVYSNQLIFTTQVALPTVTTTAASAITSTTVSTGGTVTAGADIIITSRGVCWNTAGNPTIANSKLTTGSGTGSFTSAVTGLLPNTTYYLRAYAAVSGGVGYGPEITFSTLPVNTVGTVTDVRDGKTYKTVYIGNQWWMAQNLRFYKSSGSWYYDEDSAQNAQYGRLYNYNSALTACPSGWHLPSDNEWKILEKNIGISATDVENIGWRGTNQALQMFLGGTTGFDVMFGGQKYDYGAFQDLGVIGAFWTSTQFNADNAWYRGFNNSHGDIHRDNYSKVFGYSVRCLKNTTPTVVLDSVGLLTEFSASAYINVTYDGGSAITERGICWGTTSAPTVTGSHTASGTGTGIFSIPITGLTTFTTYYARAYVKNAEGTSYSNEVTFKTKVALPTVTTTAISSITYNSAASGGTITNATGITVTSRGVCWSKIANPTIANAKTTDGNGIGTFTSSITGLSSNTTYYLRAYAAVNGGVAYGNQVTFKTSSYYSVGTLTDPRNGKTYKTIHINDQWWMSENLNYYKSGSYYYGNDSAANWSYGKLYTWNAALSACPTGWHLPGDDEWKEFEIAMGISASDVNNAGWRGTDVAYKLFADSSSGFNVKMGGQRYASSGGYFSDLEIIGTFWTSTSFDASNAWYRGFNITNTAIHRDNFPKGDAYSVRCMQNKISVLTTKAGTSITDSSVYTGGIITYDGGAAITKRGVCWSTAHNPVVGADTTQNGTGIGNFTSYIKGLQPATTYYIRAYAINSVGTSYGNEVTITTATTIPKVTTKAVTSITGISATSGGTILSAGGLTITAKGVCYDTLASPTILKDTTLNSTGTATYNSIMKNLKPNRTYYVRAYAINSNGVAYGNQVSFTTLAGLPTVTTAAVSAITLTTATSGGNVTSTGGEVVTARGICWSSTNLLPTLSDNKTTNGSGAGIFTSSLTGLTKYTKYYVRAYATNSVGTSYGDTISFRTLADLPVVTTAALSNIASNTATSGGNITNDGGAPITARGVCWSSTALLPTLSDNKSTDGTGTGPFTSSLTGLTVNTKYYVRAYATNNAGTSYGDTLSFKTLAGLPVVTTSALSAITTTSAASGGNVTNQGSTPVTALGICWSSTNLLPTISDSKTTDGTGTGPFTSLLTSLTKYTKYYVRAYATNSLGTSYGDTISFRTLADLPVVTTAALSNIASNTATSGGNITNDGGAPVTSRGVCWSSTILLPTLSDSKTSDGTGSGTYPSSLTGLTVNTKYYVRAYATNSAGTSYGDTLSFKTSAGLPVVATSASSLITTTSASSGGNVTNEGSAPVTARGICYSSTNLLPVITDSHTTDGTGTGPFASSLTSLTRYTKYYVRAYATNTSGTAYGDTVNFRTLAESPAVTTTAITNISSNSATSGGNITDDGGAPIIKKGVCWSSTVLKPTFDDSYTTDGTGSGVFSSSLTGLNINTKYYVRAYAINNADTTFGDTLSFKTLAGLPSFASPSASAIGSTSVSVTGNVTGDNGFPITMKGICWSSTNLLPVVTDDHTEEGIGTGSFTSSLTGLTRNTTYYVRTYATNANGTAYSDAINFTTLAELPVVTTATVSGVAYNTAISGGNVTDDGGDAVTARGICWGLSSNPTVEDDTTLNGTGTGVFVSNLKNLTANTTYFVRAYAINSIGTSYGNNEEFKTLFQTDSVSDIRDNQKYGEIKIGDDWWMSENLNYRVAGSVYYNNDSVTNAEIYGRLYTWEAIMNSTPSSNLNPSGVQGICPLGYHIPSKSEWDALILSLGGTSSAGSALKSTGNTYWSLPNADATNSSGYSAYPSGIIESSVSSLKGETVRYWTATEFDGTNAYYLGLTKDNGDATVANGLKVNQYSLRCVKDSID